MKVVSVVGNRPQFIKSGPLSVALRARGIDEVVVHTGQHYDRGLSQVFFEELELPPPAHSLDLQTAELDRLTPAIAEVVTGEGPDWVLVYGDTNSTLAGARAAGETSVAHVEAGLRSGDLSMPEEHNRIEVDRISSLLFTPDERSKDVLEAEGVSGRIDVVGDVMADASMRLAPLARERSRILAELELEPGAYAVATVHREANVRPDRLARILEGLSGLDERVIFPAHPRTRRTIASNTVLLGKNVALLDPLGYMDFAALASQARVILTDSGGLQKEAYWYGVPCITLRPSTEWKDTVELGANVLVDDDPDAIARAAADAQMPPDRPELYGDGHAADRIADRLISL
ncbi:MAG TPA: UDP-N-acetylglucosamine 2-epimerase (non-hydrolyzing) [Gaiellaceae bacterium]|nr:UDP-N-acetylglucosamine 2-epimerase (non-hydrolyzing) [Gaiellaceae bacterium]